MIKEKIITLAKAIASSDSQYAKEDLKRLEEFLQHGIQYVDAVNKLELALITKRNLMEGEEYRQNIQELDTRRSQYHNNLIASLNIVNRLSLEYKVSPIYSGLENRVEIANFAFSAIKEFFENRKL